MIKETACGFWDCHSSFIIDFHCFARKFISQVKQWRLYRLLGTLLCRDSSKTSLSISSARYRSSVLCSKQACQTGLPTKSINSLLLYQTGRRDNIFYFGLGFAGWRMGGEHFIWAIKIFARQISTSREYIEYKAWFLWLGFQGFKDST